MKQFFKNPLSLFLILLIILMNICRNFLWLVPSSLMSPMMAELGMNYTQAGLLVTIVTVIMGVFLVGGNFLLNYIPPLFSMVLGLAVLAFGGIGSCLAESYGVILASRVVVGMGYGLMQCATAALFTSFFPRDQLGFINGLNSCINALSISLGYALIVPIYTLLGDSWKAVTLLLSAASVVTMALFLLWFLPAKSRLAAAVGTEKQTGVVRGALSYPLVRRLIVLYACIMPVYITLSSYYPNYLHEVLHYSLEASGNLVSAMNIAGMAGCLLLGSVLHLIHRRRALYLGLFGLYCLGFAGMVTLRSELPLVIAICLFGGAYNALNAMCCTAVMTQAGIPPLVGSAGATMFAVCGSLLNLASPTVLQALTERFHLDGALIAFGLLLIPALALVWRTPARELNQTDA